MKIILLIAFFGAFTCLFYFAAGSLKISKLNIISFAYYNILIFSFVGSGVIFLGFRDHYLAEKIINEKIVNTTILILLYTIIAFPLCINFFNFVFLGKKSKHKYDNYLNLPVEYKGTENTIFFFAVLATLIGSLAVIYVFKNLGHIALFHIFDKSGEADALRSQIVREYSGNIYIRNIVFLTYMPYLSFLSYIYMRVTHKRKWILLFLVHFLMGILIKTYDYSKAPLLYYIMYFYIIEVMLGNVKTLKKIIPLGGIVLLIIYVQYTFIMGYDNHFLTLSSGPLGRIFMTQSSTLFLHVQTFPASMPYLNGASLPTVLTKTFGISESWIRSGREVMKIFNHKGIENGTAGVMNAFFPGEAYANWGITGVLLAPLLVGFLFAFVYALMLKMKKTPLAILVSLIFFIKFTETLQGGFVDYLYDSALILIICLIYCLYVVSRKGGMGIKRPIKFRR